MPAELIKVNIELLRTHPDNPRIVLRQEVIDGIANQLRESGVFQNKYALHVRPVGESDETIYQILQGHHRLEAAKEAGITTIPCWSEEMDDERAYMELALGNQQDGMSNLEWGIHVFKNVYLSEGGRGKEGGLSQYAQTVGFERTQLSKYRNAAEVFCSIENLCNDAQVLLTKALHLSTIHKSPVPTWPSLVSHLISQSWSVKDTEKSVAFLNEVIAAIPDWYGIEQSEIANIALTDEKLARQLSTSFKEATKTLESLETVTIYYHKRDENNVIEKDGRRFYVLEPAPSEFDQKQRFIEKITKFNGYPSKKQILEWHKEVLEHTKFYSDQSSRHEPMLSDAEWKAQQRAEREIERLTELQRITPKLVCGRAENMTEIPSWSIDLIVTSPPYNLGNEQWPMGGEGRKARKDGIGYDSHEDTLPEDEYQQWQLQCLKEMFRVCRQGASLFYNHKVRQKEGEVIHPMDWLRSPKNPWTLRQEIIWARTSTHNHCASLFWPEDERIYWMTKGEPTLPEKSIGMSTVWRFHGPTPNTDHPAPFAEELVERCLKAINTDNDIRILDPFCGGCTVMKVAFQNKLASIGIDVSQRYLDAAKATNGWE